MENQEHQVVNRALRNHIRFMTRMEQAFYSAIVLTAVVMSISVVFLQGRNQAIKQQITDLNSKISDEKTELNNAKQAVNELTNSDRIKEIANKAGLSINNDSIKSVKQQMNRLKKLKHLFLNYVVRDREKASSKQTACWSEPDGSQYFYLFCFYYQLCGNYWNRQ